MASSASLQLDLTTEAGVKDYLANTPFSCAHVEALTGGTGNFVFRLHLSEPHDDDRNTLILKHAQPYVKMLTSIPFDLRRQFFEVEAINRVRKWSHQTDFVTVPVIYSYDDSANVIIMEDAGPDSLTLKEYMQSGKCTVETADKLGKSIGEFLGKLHSWGRGNRQVCEFFDQNQQAKAMSSWVTYGRISSTFEEGLDKLQDPPLKPTAEESAVLEQICEETGTAMKNATDTFVMGDFWPGNLILSFNDAGEVVRVLVLDWELCKPGLFGVELGQFCAELHLLTQFNANVCAHTASILLENFLRTYTLRITPDVQLCRQTIVHLGAHLITLAPRVEWGGRDMTQKVVREGIELMVNGYSADGAWLRTSLIGPLLM